jgi:protein MPE1
MQTPCCYTAFCEDCIQSHLLEHDFVCPNCSRKVPGLDKLRKDTEARTKVAAYIEQAIEDSKNTDETMEGPSDGQGGVSKI